MKLAPFSFSFRLRIALLSAAISGIVLVGFGGAAWVWLNHERLSSLDREIRALAYRHPGWMNNRANYERLGSAIEFIFGGEPNRQLILLAKGVDGPVRFRSAHWPAEIDPAALDLRLEEEVLRREDAPSAPPTSTGVGPGESLERRKSAEVTVGNGEIGTAGERVRPGRGFGGGRGAGAAGVLPSELFTKVPRFHTVHAAGTTWRLGVLGNEQDRLVVGLNCAELNAELGRMRTAFLLALPVAVLVIACGGWIVAGQAVRPLRGIARAAEQMTARGLDQRIPVSHEDPEIARLIAVLNRMMDRLQASFHQATRFSADASHELKTPLAVMQGELEQALQAAPDGSPEQRVFASLLDETQRLKTITRGLLLLAQADSGQLVLSRVVVSLTEELAVLTTDAQVLAEASGLRWETKLADGDACPILGDRALVRLAISNLVDNAIHYNRPGGKVRVELRRLGARVQLEVANTGPGIAVKDQPHVFDRFRRGDEARALRREGLGLGLSLVREIVLAHQGELSLSESGPDWTLFRVTLPSASAQALEQAHALRREGSETCPRA